MTNIPQNGLVKVASRLFANAEIDFYRHENGDSYMTSEQIGQALEYRNPQISVLNIFNRNRQRLEPNSVLIDLISTDGKTYSTRMFNERAIYEIVRKSGQPKADEFYDWVYEVLQQIRKTGSYEATSKPISTPEFLLQVAQQMVEQDQRLQRTEQLAETAHNRIDNLDAVDTIGDLQQRLNSMIRKYARQEGISFSKGWKDFTAAFNIAYRTNLTALMENYREKHGLREVTRPQYLSMVGRLEDALRVADKMLNAPVGVGM